MPLKFSNAHPDELNLELRDVARNEQKSQFIVVYAGLVDGKSWCGDCTRAEPFINAKFAGEDKTAHVVYVGDVETWRKKDNPWRRTFNVTNLPTILKIAPDQKWQKLVEADVCNQEKLDTFVDTSYGY